MAVGGAGWGSGKVGVGGDGGVGGMGWEGTGQWEVRGKLRNYFQKDHYLRSSDAI